MVFLSLRNSGLGEDRHSKFGTLKWPAMFLSRLHLVVNSAYSQHRLTITSASYWWKTERDVIIPPIHVPACTLLSLPPLNPARGSGSTVISSSGSGQNTKIFVSAFWCWNCTFSHLHDGPAHVVQWSNHLGAMCSRAWRSQWPSIDSSLRLLKKNYFK